MIEMIKFFIFIISVIFYQKSFRKNNFLLVKRENSNGKNIHGEKDEF